MHVDASPQVHANQADDVFLRVGDKSKLQTFEERLQLNYDKSTGEVFTNYHYSLGQNSWSEYHDPNVKFICNLSSPCTMQQIADHIYNKLEFMKECQM